MSDVLKKALALIWPFAITLGILMTAGLNGTVQRNAPRYTFVGAHGYIETSLKKHPGRAQIHRPTDAKNGAWNTNMILLPVNGNTLQARFPAAEECRDLGDIWHMASSDELLHAARISSRWDAPFEGAFWASDLTEDGQFWQLVYPRHPNPVRTTEDPTQRAQVLCVNRELN
jgi:hypothetical protein